MWYKELYCGNNMIFHQVKKESLFEIAASQNTVQLEVYILLNILEFVQYI